VPRKQKGTMEEQLEKIAHNSAHPKDPKYLRSMDHLKQRDLAKDYRYPGRINAITYQKETGGEVLK